MLLIIACAPRFGGNRDTEADDGVAASAACAGAACITRLASKPREQA